MVQVKTWPIIRKGGSMKRTARTIQYVLLAALLVAGAAATYVFFEWEKPVIALDRGFDTVGTAREVTVSVSDKKSGIRSCEVVLEQGGKRIVLAREEFPSKGTLRKDLHLVISPRKLGVKDGDAVFSVTAKDYSPLRNTSVYQAKITVDSIPPVVALLSRAHNVNPGGTCLAVYRVSKPVVKSGVTCAGEFFPGYAVERQGKSFHVCYFAVPRDVTPLTPMAVTAEDRAGNRTSAGIPFYVRKTRPFRSDEVNVGDTFLQQKAVEFQQMDERCAGKSAPEVFSFVNGVIRAENDAKIRSLCLTSSASQHWDGHTFARMKNSAPKALFGDMRTYFYQGTSLGNSVHLGVDLASLAQSPVEAANAGTVVFVDFLGIYGNCVILDHGQGIFSLYAHLTSISVKPGDTVAKGQAIGVSGATGFAGGDHLHFSMLVSGVFVDPKEWWDPHWVRDNVTAKLELAGTL